MSASDRPINSDVVIVGAGPVGLTLALLLARRGRSVAVYERWQQPYPLPRAVAMSHESLRVYQSAGVLAEIMPIVDSGFGEQMADFFDKEGDVLMRIVYPGVGESGYPPMNGFHQPDLEATLERLCADANRVTIHRGWSVEAIADHPDHVELRLVPVDGDRPRDGAARTATARYVIGCDGANSSVRALAGLPVTDTGFRSSWLVVDILPKLERAWTPNLGQSLDPARPVTIAPSGLHRRRFEFMALPDEDAATLSDPATVWRLLADWGVTPDDATLTRSAYYTFRGRWADRWRAGRVLLAGDAAHEMPPFLAQGFNSGVRDAVALAWRLDLVLGDIANDYLLDSYGEERLAHVKQVVEQAVEIGRLICVTDPAAAAQRDGMLRHLRDNPGLAPPPPEWRLGPGVTMPGDPNAGFLGVQARVSRGGEEALLDDFVGGGHFTLIADGIDIDAALDDDARALWRQLDGVTAQIGGEGGFGDVDGSYAAWFAKLNAPIVLVRPDFQVFGTAADAADVNAMIAALAGQLGVPAYAEAAE